jgi:predicted nucleotidyltransferase
MRYALCLSAGGRMALSKDEMIKIANEFLELIRAKHDAREAYLFGSFAKGIKKDYSDVSIIFPQSGIR